LSREEQVSARKARRHSRRPARAVPPRAALRPRHLDTLETEFKCGRISAAAHQLGRRLARVYEQSTGALASNWPDGAGGGDPVARAASATARRVDLARQITDLESDMRTVIGWTGVRLVRAILSGEHNFTSWALVRGWDGKRGQMDAAALWRSHMADLAEHMGRAREQRCA